MSEPRIGLRNVRVEKGRRTILDVERLDVRGGEVLAVVGPNGAGKSTLIAVLGLLEKPARGEVLFDGQPISGSYLAYRRRMAVVFQEPLLLDRTVEANVSLGLSLRGVPRGERRERGQRWLARFGIAGLAERSANHLSGGEAQRVSLARAFVSARAQTVLARSAADMPVVVPVRKSTDTVNGVSNSEVFTRSIMGRSSATVRSLVIGTHISPRPCLVIKLTSSGVMHSAAPMKSPSFSRSSSSTTITRRPSRTSARASSMESIKVFPSVLSVMKSSVWEVVELNALWPRRTNLG